MCGKDSCTFLRSADPDRRQTHELVKKTDEIALHVASFARFVRQCIGPSFTWYMVVHPLFHSFAMLSRQLTVVSERAG